jgi:hypothetical protein
MFSFRDYAVAEDFTAPPRVRRRRAINQRLFWRKIGWGFLQKLAACGRFLLFLPIALRGLYLRD